MGNEQIEFTHKYLSVGYIKTLCDHEKQFERALHCLDNLKNHTLQIGNDVNEVKAECKCSGSSDNNYILTIKLNKEMKSLISANCSCPYNAQFSRKEKICKHIISLLLKHCCHDFMDARKGSFSLPTAIKLHSSKQCIKKQSMHTERKRNLPSWMSRSHEDLDNESPSNKKTKSSIIPCKQKSRMRSKKQSSHIRRTVYLMTPAELLETARDIIKEGENPDIIQKKLAENSVVETKNAEETFVPDKVAEESSLISGAPTDEERDGSYIDFKTLLLNGETQEGELHEIVRDDFHERLELQRIEEKPNKTEFEMKGSVFGCGENDEYSILDELM